MYETSRTGHFERHVGSNEFIYRCRRRNKVIILHFSNFRSSTRLNYYVVHHVECFNISKTNKLEGSYKHSLHPESWSQGAIWTQNLVQPSNWTSNMGLNLGKSPELVQNMFRKGKVRMWSYSPIIAGKWLSLRLLVVITTLAANFRNTGSRRAQAALCSLCPLHWLQLTHYNLIFYTHFFRIHLFHVYNRFTVCPSPPVCCTSSFWLLSFFRFPVYRRRCFDPWEEWQHKPKLWQRNVTCIHNSVF